MTILDEILSLIQEIDIIAGVQVTPQRIKLVVGEESFWKIIKKFTINNIVFEFLEQRESAIDIHILFFHLKYEIEITLRVITSSSTFFDKLVDLFPSSRIYLQEIWNK